MVIFHCYVSSPEGKTNSQTGFIPPCADPLAAGHVQICDGILDIAADVHNHPGCKGGTHLGVSENSVPLNPMVNDHYPY